MLDLNEIEAYIEPTTPAPWEFVDDGNYLYIEAPGVPWGTAPTIPYRIGGVDFHTEPPAEARQQIVANLKFAARSRTWLPALVEELRETRLENAKLRGRVSGMLVNHSIRKAEWTTELEQAREELAAVDESLGDFYAPVLNPETEEPCGSFWKDHGVWAMRDALELARAELERLRAFVPSPELMQRLATLDEDYARCVGEAGEEANADDRT